MRLAVNIVNRFKRANNIPIEGVGNRYSVVDSRKRSLEVLQLDYDMAAQELELRSKVRKNLPLF